ncbi:polysaccharide biosynthesis/export family protein [Rhizobium sp. NTR19]|uniref:Polysaccharide biosynthesis/export family protein n=1 Tax=Neorhizobium turbinariae TaxID=2937795 RepID=A0ABT0IX42_9HYPH|nr:polysaccharide biosynthesis/export family protein [Neorhizobium turbinariae]MCK8782457.1 polysaccharide biosynthesis/export family protein [Neorhizobium turbinariae]
MRGMAGLAGLLMCLPLGGAAAQTTYKLKPGDTMQLWIAQEPDLTRDIVIAPDGWLSVPLAGHLKGEGLSLQELEAQLLDRLKVYFNDKPNLTLMLRPNSPHQPLIYVTGEVVTPGEYPYRPNMTVLHCISVAGGIYRTALLPADQDRSILVGRQVEQSQARLDDLRARIVRLEAEIRGERSLAKPEALAASPALQREQTMLNSRMEALDLAERAQTEANDLLERTAAALREQTESLSKRVELARRRLQSIANLVAKGGAESSQQWVQEGVVAELEGQISRLQSEMSMAERDRIAEVARYESIRQERRTQLLVELNAARLEQDDVAAQLADGTRIMSVYGQNAALVQQRQTRVLHYNIVRFVEGETQEIPAFETTPVLAGDLLRVVYGDSLREPVMPAGPSEPSPVARLFEMGQ